MFKLYKPEKYKVYVGKNPNTGLITCWNEPKRVFEVVEKHIGITSTLYSKYGINIILRNLALNPNINTLYVWANGPLSNTEVGKQGFTTIKNIWAQKPNAFKEFELEDGIDKSIVEKIINNVKLVDISDKKLNDLESFFTTQRYKKTSYMESVKFKDPKQEDFVTFPAEEAGFLVRGNKIADTWTKAVEKIMRYGVKTGTQYGYRQKQLVGLNWVVENEDPSNLDLGLFKELPNGIKKTIVADKKALEQYNKEVFEKTKQDSNLSYTYGNRLQQYPIPKGSLNQVETTMLDNLKSSIDSRRAVATTIVPATDSKSTEPPCLCLVQALHNNNKLHLIATFRSHDIYKAGISNAFGLLNLQNHISKKLKVKPGCLQIVSQSAHIYEQDWKDADLMAKCFIREQEPAMFWDHTQNSDPRGNVLVSVVDNQIELTLQNSKGGILTVLTGKSAKYLSLKLAKLDLINRVDHVMDIARQLQKAEIAIQNNLEFNQDQPLKI